MLVLAAIALVGLAPKEFAVEREIVIDRSKADTFAYLKFLKNQEVWGPWAKRDPNMKHEYQGTDGEVGFVSGWVSESEGTGEQEIKKIVDGERIDVELRFKDPFESTSSAWLTTEAVGADQTKVKWGMKGNMPMPFNAMMVFIDMESAVAKDFDEGLASLKTELEK